MTISLATPCKNCTHPKNVHVEDPNGTAAFSQAVGVNCITCSCVQFEPDPCHAGHTEYCDHQCESYAPQSRIRCTSFPEHVGRHSHPDALGGRRFWSDDAKPWCDTCRGMVAGQCRVCGRIKNPEPVKFETKDSGERVAFVSGMVRDTDDGKARFELLLPEGVPYPDQFLTRVAELMARGAEKYDSRNWEKANSEGEMERNRSSAFRHLIQWMSGDETEDHAAAVVFNLLAHETTKWKREQ